MAQSIRRCIKDTAIVFSVIPSVVIVFPLFFVLAIIFAGIEYSWKITVVRYKQKKYIKATNLIHSTFEMGLHETGVILNKRLILMDHTLDC